MRATRAGVTLLVLLVVLVLLGLAAAAVSPALRAPRSVDADPLAATVARARALAVRRAEALRLEIDGDGRWRLSARDSVLQVGTLPTAHGATLRLAISPTGLCVPEADEAVTPSAHGWDAGACAPATDTLRAGRERGA